MLLSRSTGRSLRQFPSSAQLLARVYGIYSHKNFSISQPKRANAKAAPEKSKIQTPLTTPQKTETDEAQETKEQRFTALFLTLTQHNNYGDVGTAVDMYEKIQNTYPDMLELKYYNAIISSFAPRKLMFGWYKPYKDFVDMYHECAKFRPQEVRY